MATVVVYRARRASRMKGRKKRSSLVMEAIMAPMTDQSTGLAFFKFISCLPLCLMITLTRFVGFYVCGERKRERGWVGERERARERE